MARKRSRTIADAQRAINAATAEQVAALSDSALTLGRETAFSAKEAAAGIDALAAAGVGVEQILESAATTLTEREFSAGQRKTMAKSGAAMSGGSFPIASEQDLKNAIQAYGRAGDKAAAKMHIVKRARALGLTKLLPDGWLDSMSEADRSLLDQYTAVTRAIEQKYRPSPGLMPYDEVGPSCYVKDVFDSYAIVCKGDELYRIDYTVGDDGTITLADPVAVEIAYQPVSETDISARPASAEADPASAGAPVEISESATLLESKSEKGSAWRVLLIKAGTSGNRRHYPAEMLKESAHLFEGVQAFADHPTKSERRERPERSSRDVVGWYANVAWDEKLQGLTADFNVVESAEWLMKSLKSAWDKGKADLLGFSINAEGSVAKGRGEGGSDLIEAFTRVFSTDVVTTPGAGGRLLGVLESDRSSESDMDPEEIKRLIAEAMAAGLTGLQSQLTETLKTLLAEQAATAQAAVGTGGGGGAATAVTEAVAVTEQQTVDTAAVTTALTEAQGILAEIKKQNRISAVSARVDAAKLPAVHTARVKARLLEAAGKRDVEDAEIDAEIQFVRDTIAESGPARPSWGGMSLSAGDSHHDKLVKAITGWFEGAAVDGVPPVRDLRESYGLWAGQSYMDVDPFEMFSSFARRYDSGRDHKKITESLATTDWGQVFADVFYLQMIKEYAASPDYDKWRMIVSDIESVPDFRTRHWTRVGGYGDLPAVLEGATYQPMTSPGDEEINYAVSKTGGLEDITIEMLLGDRLQQVRRAPQRMAYAASRTLYKFVFNMATTDNPTMDYDSVALYDAAHGNTGTTALSVAGLDAVKVAMRSQTAFGQSLEILGTRNAPKILIVPNELESRAKRIIDPSDAYAAALASSIDTNTELDPHMFKGSGIMVHVYDQLTDANDWWIVADPKMVPTIVMGFLNGRTEPELFTQDQPNVGSAFTADKISYKIRAIYGGSVQEHRSMYRQVVT